GILNKRAESRACYSEVEFAKIANAAFDPERLRACLNDGNRLGMTIIGNKERLFVAGATASGYSVTKRHCFSSGRGFVQHGSVCDVEGSQIYDHLLEVQQRFEASLRDFRLVRRVSGVPARVFENVSLNDRRRDAVVVASSDKRARDFVLLCNRA